MRLSVLFLLIFRAKVHSFNFDVDFPIVFKEPVPYDRSYFGYALAMYPGDNRGGRQWIRIGAPRANDPAFPKIPQPGMVYNCQVLLDCKPMKFPHTTQSGADEIWKQGWIGGTMDVSYSNDTERLAVCGFHHYYEIDKDYRTLGTCFWSHLNSSRFQTITPLLAFGQSVSYVNKQSVYLYGQGQAGFSAHFPENDNELILGAPGIYNWAGTPFRVKDRIYFNPEPSRRRRDIDPFKMVEVPDITKNEAFNLFGYSVSSGYYHGKDILYYAAGSPKAIGYKGKVVIFSFGASGSAIIEKEHKVGQEFGEYFGASLASGKINDDENDDLLVGSPYFSGKTFNEGKVYIFLGGKGSLKLPKILIGTNKGGQFGSAIMYLGDINQDGFGEVAIGAPYENGNTGTVYIYNGNSEGLVVEPCQKIVGKDIVPGLLGFGISISKAVDMDNNGYKDISIGAHLSRSAVFLRSRPLVVIHYSFSSNPKIISLDTRDFTLNICFSYEMFQEKSVDIIFNVTVDKLLGRANLGQNATISENVTILKNSQPLCKNLTVTIKDSLDLDIKIPIKVSVSYALNYPVAEKSVTYISNKVQGNDSLCIRCPVLDVYKSNQTFFETEIPFTLGCGSDNECQSFLNVAIKFPGLSNNTFLLGSSNYLNLDITVENTEENAYSTKLYLVLPEFVYFRQTPSKCKSENASAMLCDIANPLKMNEKKQLFLDIDVRNINNGLEQDHLDIYSRIITSSNNSNTDAHSFSIYLRREADITIYGKTQQETNYYSNSSINSSLLTHTYKIEKFGVGSLEKLTVKLQIPFKYEIQNEQIPFLGTYGADAYFGGQPFTCEFYGITVQKRTKLVDLEETSRRRRSVEVFKNISEVNKKEDIKINDEEVAIANKTLFLNCTTPGVTCFDVVCNFGPYDKVKLPASIQINMIINISMIGAVANTMDMVLISTNGQVIIDAPKNFIQTGNRDDYVEISTVFINDNTKVVPVALWIIILAVIIGLLLLLLLILVFFKIGFFKRKKKEELDNLKAAAMQEDKIMEIIQGGDKEEDEEDDQEIEELEVPYQEQANMSTEDLCLTK